MYQVVGASRRARIYARQLAEAHRHSQSES